MARAVLGWALYLSDQPQAALAPAEAAVASHTSHPLVRTYAIGVLALAHHRLGHHDQVTLNTIKMQTRAIYQKPGAADRAQAIAHARARGPLPS